MTNPYDESPPHFSSLREAVRRRPGMYVGGNDTEALHWMLAETLRIHFLQDSDLRITKFGADNRGITLEFTNPTLLADENVHEALDKLINPEAASSFFIRDNWLAVVNALSQSFRVEYVAGDQLWHKEFERGALTSEQQTRVSPSSPPLSVSFLPDSEVFVDVAVNEDRLAGTCQEYAFLNRGRQVLVHRHGEATPWICYHFPRGLASFVDRLVPTSRQSIPTIEVVQQLDVTDSNQHTATLKLEAAFRLAYFPDSDIHFFLSYVNGIRTFFGGSHVEGLLRAVRDNLLGWASDRERAGKVEASTLKEIQQMMVGGISVYYDLAEFNNSMAWSIKNPEVEDAVYRAVTAALDRFASDHPYELERIRKRVSL